MEELYFGRWVLCHLPYHPLDLSGFGKELRGDANGASEMRITKRPKHGIHSTGESRPRATHLRFADLSPAGLA